VPGQQGRALFPLTFFVFLLASMFRTLALILLLAAGSAQAASVTAPPLDLNIQYYSKAVTAEGVTREVRYQETMLRRPGHVWVARVLPPQAAAAAAAAHAGEHERSVHKHFNPAQLPRHVQLAGDKPRLEYVDLVHKKSSPCRPANMATLISMARGRTPIICSIPSW
jgi:hypothetical protein